MDSPAGQAARAQLEIVKVSVDDLAREAHDLHQLLIRRTRIFIVAFAIVGLILAVAILSASVVLLDNRERIAENNQKLCPILTLMVPKPKDPPATSTRGRLVALRAARLAEQYGCATSGS